MIRVIVLGFGDIAAASLKAIMDGGFPVAGVVSHRGAGNENALELAARRAGVPLCLLPITSPETSAFIQSARPDLLVSVSFRSIVPPEILAIPTRGGINVHGSLLPKYRGRTPAVWAIINGERMTGITVHYMTEDVDAGDIILQEELPLTAHDTGGTVVAKFLQRCPPLVVEAIRRIDTGRATAKPQDHTQATYGTKRSPEDGQIRWAQPARRLYDWVRALTHPYPGAFATYRGRRVWIWEMSVIDEMGQTAQHPGTIVGVQTGVVHEQCGVVVAASPGRIVVHRFQFEGEAEADAYALWEAGRLVVGDAFE